MKKILLLMSVGLMIFSLTACAGSPRSDSAAPAADDSRVSEQKGQEEEMGSAPELSEETDTTEPVGENDVLVAYFSKTGNTETIANMIAGYTGGDLFRVETVTVYPDEYNDLIEVAKEEQDNDERPELASAVEDMDRYQTVFIGYPNWWGTMPMAMFTFLESYDFAGKTVIPFCTHEGSALGRSESDIAALIPEAELQKGLAVRGSNVDSAEDDVVGWLEELGFESPADGD